MRILTSLTSVAFFSACSSFSWASFNDSEYLSSSSSTPFSFFCRPSSSSSSYTQTHKGNLRGIWEQCREKKIAGLTFCFNTSCSSRLISEIVLGIFLCFKKKTILQKICNCVGISIRWLMLRGLQSFRKWSAMQTHCDTAKPLSSYFRHATPLADVADGHLCANTQVILLSVWRLMELIYL